MEFSTILKDLRKNNNLTQEELAQKVGVSPAAIGLYEQGVRLPRNSTMKRISNFFDVSVDYLLGIETKKESTTSYYNGKNPEIRQIINTLETADIPDGVIDFINKALEAYRK